MILIWILPLFEAEPMLTPIRREIDFFVPPPFPLHFNCSCNNY